MLKPGSDPACEYRWHSTDRNKTKISAITNGHHTFFTKSFSFAKARFWLPRRCDSSMLGVYTPLPLRNEPQSTTQQHDCLWVDENLVELNKQLGLDFNQDDLLDLAVRIGKTMLACA